MFILIIASVNWLCDKSKGSAVVDILQPSIEITDNNIGTNTSFISTETMNRISDFSLHRSVAWTTEQTKQRD